MGMRGGVWEFEVKLGSWGGGGGLFPLRGERMKFRNWRNHL